MIRVTLQVILFLFAGSALCQSGSAARAIKAVQKIPYIYEYPSRPNASNYTILSKPWVVYSDRNDNAVFKDRLLSKSISTVSYLDSFYVVAIFGEALELIRYRSVRLKDVTKISEPGRIEYVGWVDKSHLLLSNSSTLNVTSKLPVKYNTMLNGTRVFDQFITYTSGASLNVYSNPELTTRIPGASLEMNEVVYVFKYLGDKVLIGKSPSFQTQQAAANILGWVSSNFVQSWGTRLCVEPALIYNNDSSFRFIYPTKDQAINFSHNEAVALAMKQSICGPEEKRWSKNPVFTIETVKKNNIDYKLIETGTVIHPFDQSHAFVYAGNGNKISHSKFCALSDAVSTMNVVFVLNMDNDTKEYIQTLTQSIQELDEFFLAHKQIHEFQFAVVNGAEPLTTKPVFVGTYAEIMPRLLTIVKDHVQFRKPPAASGILTGLTTAAQYFKNHESENNVVVVISSQGDDAFADPAYKIKSNNLSNELAVENARVVFFQPYSNNGNMYASFVPQAKGILSGYSKKAATTNAGLTVGKTEQTYTDAFRSIDAAPVNIYCLDYPEASSTQGFIIFPTIGTKTDGKYLHIALDSLFKQSAMHTTSRLLSIHAAFNSSSVFNNKINTSFERYYNLFEAMPVNAESRSKNINFSYFAHGYSISPALSYNPVRYYRQSLLLSAVEYDELYELFKSLKTDVLAQSYSDANKKACYDAFKTALNRYSARTGRIFNRNETLATFFYETCGHQTSDPILEKFYMRHFISQMYISKEEFQQMIERLNKAFTVYYALKGDKQSMFESNGSLYYWIEESELP